MFQVNDDLSIYVTRGDMVFLRVKAEKNGMPYTFEAGEVLRIKVFAKKKCEDVVLQKDFPVTTATQSVDIILDGNDTKIGGVISKPVDYWYEVELNPYDNPQTIIGYDEEGTRIFRLFPEGRDIPEIEPEPEVIKVIDTELDMTSTRPVQNQVIARAFANLQDGYRATHEAVAKLHVTPQMFGAIGDGVADDTEAFRLCILAGSDVVLTEGRYRITDTLNIDDYIKVHGKGDVVIDFEGDTLFNISTYYKKPFELENVQINSNGNRVINASNGGWGASFLLNNVVITEATDSCIELGGAFNAVFRNVNIEGNSSSTGTLLRLGVNASSTAFSNLIYLESCIVSANRNANLIEVGNAISVKAVNCTLTGFNNAITGTMTLIGCWFEDGEQCFPNNYDGLVISPHFANVANVSVTGTENYDYYPNVKKTSTLVYDNSEQSIMQSMFGTPVEAIESLYAAGYMSGVYAQSPIYKVGTDMVLYNVPINKIWATSDTSWLGFKLDRFVEQYKGIFEVKINYFRITDGNIAQRCSWHGIIKDGEAIMLDTMDSISAYPSSLSYDSTNNYLTYGSANGGSSMGWIEFNRLSI